MDDIDREILTLLQADATTPSAEMAEQLGLSSATLWRRIKSLEAVGILRGRVALADPGKCGLGTAVLIGVTLKDHSPERRAAFERMVSTTPQIMECQSVSGPHDYRLMVRVSTIAAYEAFLMNRILDHPEVASAETSFVLREIKYTTALPL